MKRIGLLVLILMLGCDINTSGECLVKCVALRIGHPIISNQVHFISENDNNSWTQSEYTYDTDVRLKCCCFASYKYNKSYFQKVWVANEKCIFMSEDLKQ